MDNPLHALSSVPKTAPSFTPLRSDELPKKGDIVALDAEFVRVASEESIQTPGGRRLVVKPVQFSLGRVSVLRGWGNKEEEQQQQHEPFIDDYISTPESQIQDYLTQYSGLRYGDLDRTLSSHHVTTLKHAYLKLRRLVDRGCLLVGHGLSKDFRMINIVVPPSQIADTVEIFYLEGQRRVSLRFLAALLLGADIQRHTHDSIEDARTALDLYRVYVGYKAELQLLGRPHSVFTNIVKLIYALGRRINWAVEQLTPELKADFQSDVDTLLQLQIKNNSLPATTEMPSSSSSSPSSS
jgi:PAB-dependent poly(A)-specific ribonuclease subunit 2